MRVRAKPFAVEIKNARKSRNFRDGLADPSAAGDRPQKSWAAGLLGEIEKEALRFDPPPAAATAPAPTLAAAAPAPRILQDLTAPAAPIVAPDRPPEAEIADTPYLRVRQIDRERKRLVANAKREAIRAALRAIEVLNELGFAYRLEEVPRRAAPAEEPRASG